MKCENLIPLLFVCVLASCSNSSSKDEFFSDGMIINSSFESGDTYWVTSSTSVSNDKAYIGDSSLKVGNLISYDSYAYQRIKNLKPGFYYLTAKTFNEGNQEYCYLYGKGSNQNEQMTSVPVSYNNQWTNVIVRGIKVESDGLLDVGLRSKGNNQFCYFDDICLFYENNQQNQYPSLFGGAISWLDWEEDMGAKYYDENQNEKDALEIMKENGCNFVRLELYNNPGHYVDKYGDYFPEGYKDQDSILALAKRAKEKGMEIELSFMYSDYWGNDVIPYDWEEKINKLSSFDEKVNSLSSSLYNWTYSYLARLKEEQIEPKYISIGNEIDPGILMPYGSVYSEDRNRDAFALFLNKGYQAVKEVFPTSQVVLHIGCNADDLHWESKSGTGIYFFNLMKEKSVNYDIIGTSFYPFWAQTDSEWAVKKKLDLNDLKEWCELMIDTFDKDILIMESGYNWGTPGQLSNNGAYENIYLSSPQGQRDFVIDLINTIKSVKDGRCIGDLYWDPILVRQNGIGYALHNDGQARPNVVETTTFFDYNHIALPVLKAYKYN